MPPYNGIESYPINRDMPRTMAGRGAYKAEQIQKAKEQRQELEFDELGITLENFRDRAVELYPHAHATTEELLSDSDSSTLVLLDLQTWQGSKRKAESVIQPILNKIWESDSPDHGRYQVVFTDGTCHFLDVEGDLVAADGDVIGIDVLSRPVGEDQYGIIPGIEEDSHVAQKNNKLEKGMTLDDGRVITWEVVRVSKKDSVADIRKVRNNVQRTLGLTNALANDESVPDIRTY